MPQPDEVIQEFNMDWDGKRDRWNGYNPEEYTRQLAGAQKRRAVQSRGRGRDLTPHASRHPRALGWAIAHRVGAHRPAAQGRTRQGNRQAAAEVRAGETTHQATYGRPC